MSNFVEFVIGPHGVRPTVWCWWEIRNASMTRIMEGAWAVMKRNGSINRDWTVRVHSADCPTEPTARRGRILEFQTIGDSLSAEGLFPDWNFGGWWHMGMKDWDPFVASLAAAGRGEPTDRRAYWRGSHLGIEQRKRYVDHCESDPERFTGGFMEWGSNGASQGFVPMAEQAKHSIMVDLTGLGYSGRLKMLGFMGRPLMVADRRWWCWGDQVALSKGLHWRVKADLSDLREVYDEITENPESRKTAERMRDFCLSELTFERACLRAAGLMEGAIWKRSVKVL